MWAILVMVLTLILLCRVMLYVLLRTWFLSRNVIRSTEWGTGLLSVWSAIQLFTFPQVPDEDMALLSLHTYLLPLW